MITLYNAMQTLCFIILTHHFCVESYHNNCRFVAGAACPKEIVNFMDSVGIPVCEGYGKSTDCTYCYLLGGFCVPAERSTSLLI